MTFPALLVCLLLESICIGLCMVASFWLDWNVLGEHAGEVWAPVGCAIVRVRRPVKRLALLLVFCPRFSLSRSLSISFLHHVVLEHRPMPTPTESTAWNSYHFALLFPKLLSFSIVATVTVMSKALNDRLVVGVLPLRAGAACNKRTLAVYSILKV